MRIPFVDLTRVVSLVEPRMAARWAKVVEQAAFVGGSSVVALEAELGRRLGAGQVVCCGSGTDALRVSLQAIGVGPGQVVALPNLTFWATYEAVVQLGATPLLIDVDPLDLQLDLEELARAFDRHRFGAAILVHLMGWASGRLGAIRAFCRERDIALLEDAAQAFGVEVGGRSVFEGAEVSALSFYPAKVLGGCADGGAVLTDDVVLARKIRALCNHGRSSHFAYDAVGWCSRMGGLQAEWLLEMLEHAETIVAERRALEMRYRTKLDGRAEARSYGPPPGIDGNGYLSVWTVDPARRDALAARLEGAGVTVGRVYPSTIADQEPARDALRISALSRSRELCERVLNLPLYYGMRDEEQDYVAATLEDALATAR